MLSPNEVLIQSKNAFNQWKDVWEKNAKKNGEIYKQKCNNSHKDLLYVCAGKAFLCIGLGPSLENEIEVLRQYKTDAVMIGCVDKALGALLEHGIKPDFVFLCDANVSYETWCKPWNDKTKDITLIANVCAHTDWAENWQGEIYFFVNKDNINTQDIYCPLSGVNEVIPAGSNVGNSIIIFATQIFGADYYLLLGYDFCWRKNDNYYAFNDGGSKRYWMSHTIALDEIGNLVSTSQNLFFSARWLADYTNFVLGKKGIRVINCSGGGLLGISRSPLKNQLQLATKRKISNDEKNMIAKNRINQVIVEKPDKLNEVLSTHNVNNIIVNYLTDKSIELLKSLN